MKINMLILIQTTILLFLNCCNAEDLTTRLMYDSMARLVGDTEYPENW